MDFLTFKAHYLAVSGKCAKEMYLRQLDLADVQKMVERGACSVGVGSLRIPGFTAPQKPVIFTPADVEGRKVPKLKLRKSLAVAYDFISDDICRPALHGVYFDKKNACIVSTDTHKLFIAPFDVPKEKDGRLFAKNGEEIQGTFPNYRRVIPDITHTATLQDVESVRKACYTLQDLNKVEYAKLPKIIATLNLHIGDFCGNFAVKQFLPALEAMLSLGETEITIGFNEKKGINCGMIVFLGKRAKILVMGYGGSTAYSYNVLTSALLPATRSKLQEFYG